MRVRKRSAGNAVRCLLAFGSKEQIERIPVYAGAAEPLIRISRVDNGASTFSRLDDDEPES